MRKLFIVAIVILTCQFVNGQVLTAKVFLASQDKPEQVFCALSPKVSKKLLPSLSGVPVI